MSSSPDMSADRPDALERQPRATGGSTFDRIKTTVAEKLRAAAHTVEEKSASARGRSEGLSSYGHQAAGWLDKSANYIEEADPQRIKSDIENQVRSNPGRSLLIAGAVGLFLGTLLRRR